MKLMPASRAAWTIDTQSSWSWLPQGPNIIAPRHSGLTLTPVRPSVRCSMPRKPRTSVEVREHLGADRLGHRRGAAVDDGGLDRGPVGAEVGGDRGREPGGRGQEEWAA